MAPPRVVLQASAACLFCGATDNLTTEHIVPFSLGGRIELPNGSCTACAEITKKLEQHVARDHLSIPRSIGGVQTRRPLQRPNETTLELTFKDGRTVKKNFSLDVAPIVNIVPNYKPIGEDFWEGQLLSTCTLQAMGHWKNAERYDRILKQTGAEKVSVSSGAVEIGAWTRVLWKMACGFFHVVCPSSLAASGRNKTVIGDDATTFWVTKEGIEKKTAREKLLLFEDIFWDLYTELANAANW